MRSRLGRRGPDPAVVLGPVVGVLLLLGASLAVARSGTDDVVLSNDAGLLVIPSATTAPQQGLEGVLGATPTAPASPGDPVETAVAAPSESSPGPTASPVPPATPPATSGPLAEVGTCFDGSPDSVPAIVPISCDEAHGNEVYVLVDDEAPPGSPYPGRESLLDRTAELCRGQAFDEYVGAPWAESRFFTSPVVPTEDSWGKGDRSVACFLYDLNGTRVGSARGHGAG